MIHVAIAGTPEGAANFIAALNALGAEGKDVLQETDFSGYDALILPGGADIDPALFGEEINGSRKIEPERDRREHRHNMQFRLYKTVYKQPVLMKMP